jgi:hypothetical protein
MNGPTPREVTLALAGRVAGAWAQAAAFVACGANESWAGASRRPRVQQSRPMPWFVWVLILLVVVTMVFGAIGRSLQRKGRDVERHRD